ncbi:MAG: hypothetical protein LBC27_00940 [Spirochaetaceae bacterium]|jgi:hypothetical protein|nr:hypothetical protein [Spirochaetaceae bacterium]
MKNKTELTGNSGFRNFSFHKPKFVWPLRHILPFAWPNMTKTGKRTACRIILVYILALVLIPSAPLFAEEDAEPSNAVFIDVGEAVLAAIYNGFGAGAGYERALSDNFSVIISGDVFSIDYNKARYFGLGAGMHTRYYLLRRRIKDLFIDMGGNYAYTSIEYNNQTIASNTFELSVLAGWKFVLGKDAGLFIEPGYGYTFNFGEIKLPDGVDDGLTNTLKSNPINGQKLWLGVGFAF